MVSWEDENGPSSSYMAPLPVALRTERVTQHDTDGVKAVYRGQGDKEWGVGA